MASISRTALFNRALIKIGVPRIADPGEDTEVAHVCSEVFDTLARSELTLNPWSFAIRRTTLAALSDPPAFEWGYQFVLPEGFLRVVQLGDYYEFADIRGPTNQPAAPYAREGSLLLTNMSGAVPFRYVKDVSDDLTGWDAMFFEAFACRLAFEVCETLTKSATKKEAVAKEYRSALTQARRINAIQTPPQVLPDNSWVTARQI